MGLLSLGTPLDWHESKQYNEHVRDNGIKQLINIFKQHGSRQNDIFYWGDEVEYMLVDMDDARKTAKLSIDRDYILLDLNDPEKPESYQKCIANNILFHPEYGRFMIEATPLRPYHGDRIRDYLYVEENMARRRLVSQSELPSNIKPLTLTAFPRMGCPEFTSPATKPIGPASQSLFLPDEIINRHVRFPTLTANIRKRRGSKVAINLPMYPDKNTKLLDDSIPRDRDLFSSDREPSLGAASPGHVYMDSMGFGMGSSCLQVTVQAKDIDEARYLYDSLAPWTPVLLALSAAAPVFKGYLVNQDVRWNVISGAVDDRTFLERDVDPYPGYSLVGGLDVPEEVTEHMRSLGGVRGVNGDRVINENGETKVYTNQGRPLQKIPKSRYDSIDNYLGDGTYGSKKPYFKDEYNDINSPINKKVYDQLVNAKYFDDKLATHFAHLFIRDPLVIFSERLDQDNELSNDHFENLQSTNWQTLRFKPPALYAKDLSEEELAKTPGWRVEFRPLEIQLSDFENAAYSVFVTLLSRAVLKYMPDLYIPILKIDENMATAHKVDAVLNDKFWFKSFDLWNIDLGQFVGYDLSWFDRFINHGNDDLAADEVYVKGYNEPAVRRFSNDFVPASEQCQGFNESKVSVRELINGNSQFPGILRIIIKYIATDLLADETNHHCLTKELALKMLRLQSYLRLISYRASGKIPTTAHWLRQQVLRHQDYKRDSKVSSRINYDIIKESTRVSRLEPDILEEFFGSTISDYLLGTGAKEYDMANGDAH